MNWSNALPLGGLFVSYHLQYHLPLWSVPKFDFNLVVANQWRLRFQGISVVSHSIALSRFV